MLKIEPENNEYGLKEGEKLILAIKPFGVFFLNPSNYVFIIYKILFLKFIY